MDNGKALDIVTLNLGGKTALTDYIVISSGTSSRHVMALAEKLIQEAKKMGIPVIKDGFSGTGDWVVLDMSSVIVHIFNPEKRAYYALEDLWK